MGELVGYVTQIRGAPFQDIHQTHRGDSTGRSLNAFSATHADGRVVGTEFTTQQRARRALENEVGPPALQWRRADRNNNRIERYEGRDPRFYPGDQRLVGGAWLRGDQGVRQFATATAGAPRRVTRWSSFNTPGALTAAVQATPALMPEYGPGIMGGQDALVFDETELRVMPTNLTLAPPITVHAVARWRDAGRDQIVVQSTGGFSISVVGGDWMVDAGGTLINAGAAVAGRVEIISVRSTAVGPLTQVYRNGVGVGSAADAPVSGDWTVSDAADAWYQHIGEIVIDPSFETNAILQQMVTYFRRRYLIEAP